MSEDVPTGGSRVRVAVERDAEVLAGLLRDFNAEFDTPTDPVAQVAARFARLIGGPAGFALLAEEQGPGGPTAYGFALVTLRPSVYADGPVAVLDELYVRPDRRGGGTGSALVAAMRAELSTRDCEEIQINVDSVDTGARRFYERLGFVNVERAEDGPMLCYIGPAAQ